MDKKDILLVEDDMALSGLIQKKLVGLGFEVRSAEDGERALELLKEKAPDLVLLDMMLPKLNGMEVLREIRKDDDLKELPVVVISNSGQPVEIEEALELGAQDWLVKADFDPQEVVTKVQRFLEQ